MIRSKRYIYIYIYIYISTILDIFCLTHVDEDVWPDGTHPMSLAEQQVVSAYQSFRPVAPFFYLESTVFGFLNF